MYKRIENEWIKHLNFILFDLLGFQLAFRLSYLFLNWYSEPSSEQFYSYQALGFLVVQLVVILVTQPYSHILRRGNDVEVLSTVKTTAIIMVTDILFLFLVKESSTISRVFLFTLSCLAVLIMWTFRTALKKYLQARKGVNAGDRALIIFTSSHQAEEVVSGLMNGTYNDFNIKGVYLLDKGMKDRKDILGIPLINNKVPLFEAIGHEWVDEAFFFLSPDYLLPKCYIDNLLKMGITIHFSYSSLFEKGIMQRTDKIGSYYVFTNSLKIVNSTSLAV